MFLSPIPVSRDPLVLGRGMNDDYKHHPIKQKHNNNLVTTWRDGSLNKIKKKIDLIIVREKNEITSPEDSNVKHYLWQSNKIGLIWFWKKS